MADDKLLNDDNDRTVPFDSNRSLRTLNHLSKCMRRTWTVRKKLTNCTNVNAVPLIWHGHCAFEFSYLFKLHVVILLPACNLDRHANHHSQVPNASNHGAYRICLTHKQIWTAHRGKGFVYDTCERRSAMVRQLADVKLSRCSSTHTRIRPRRTPPAEAAASSVCV